MLNPKTPLQAGLVFAAGLVVIVWTTNDVYRTSKQNSQGITPEQMKALRDFGNEARRHAAGQKRSHLPRNYGDRYLHSYCVCSNKSL